MELDLTYLSQFWMLERGGNTFLLHIGIIRADMCGSSKKIQLGIEDIFSNNHFFT